VNPLARLIVRLASTQQITRLADIVMLAIGLDDLDDAGTDPGGALIRCLGRACLAELARRGRPWSEGTR
jgi:hypothetical protein